MSYGIREGIEVQKTYCEASSPIQVGREYIQPLCQETAGARRRHYVFLKRGKCVMTLTDLPNIGPKLADNLRRVGLSTPEQLREIGTREAFPRIRAQVDPTACFHQLTALAGAEAGIPKKALPQEEKASLRIFFNSL